MGNEDQNDRGHRPKRLRRLTSIFSERRPLFLVTCCTHERKAMLANAQAHQVFVSFGQVSPQRAQVWVGRYVLMPDHLHVFVSAQDSQALSRWVGSLKKFMAKHWRSAGHAAPFWQEGFFDHLLRSGESYSEKWDHVRQNPARAGLVKHAEDWPYCGELHELSWD